MLWLEYIGGGAESGWSLRSIFTPPAACYSLWWYVAVAVVLHTTTTISYVLCRTHANTCVEGAEWGEEVYFSSCQRSISTYVCPYREVSSSWYIPYYTIIVLLLACRSGERHTQTQSACHSRLSVPTLCSGTCQPRQPLVPQRESRLGRRRPQEPAGIYHRLYCRYRTTKSALGLFWALVTIGAPDMRVQSEEQIISAAPASPSSSHHTKGHCRQTRPSRSAEEAIRATTCM